MLEYARPVKVGLRLWHVLLLVGIGALLFSFFLPTPRRGYPAAAQIKCASNLRQIGQAILLYAADKGGAFPDGLAIVLDTQLIGSDVFVCPESKERKATGASTSQIVADFGMLGRCSYVYLDSGLSLGAASPEAIIAFEDPANHSFRGANVLFADGHVDWLTMPEFMANLKDLTAGVNPPTSLRMASEEAARKEYDQKWRGRMGVLKVQGMKVGAAKVNQLQEVSMRGMPWTSDDQERQAGEYVRYAMLRASNADATRLELIPGDPPRFKYGSGADETFIEFSELEALAVSWTSQVTIHQDGRQVEVTREEFREVRTPPAQMGPAVAGWMKSMAGLDITETVRAQSNTTEFSINKNRYRVRIETTPTPAGERVTMMLER